MDMFKKCCNGANTCSAGLPLEEEMLLSSNVQAQWYASSLELVERQRAVNLWEDCHWTPRARRTLSEAFEEYSKGNLAKKRKKEARSREKRYKRREKRKIERVQAAERQEATAVGEIARPGSFTAEAKEVDLIHLPPFEEFLVGQEWMTEAKAREEILRKLIQLRDQQSFLTCGNATSSVKSTGPILKEIPIGTDLLETIGTDERTGATKKQVYTPFQKEEEPAQVAVQFFESEGKQWHCGVVTALSLPGFAFLKFPNDTFHKAKDGWYPVGPKLRLCKDIPNHCCGTLGVISKTTVKPFTLVRVAATQKLARVLNSEARGFILADEETGEIIGKFERHQFIVVTSDSTEERTKRKKM